MFEHFVALVGAVLLTSSVLVVFATPSGAAASASLDQCANDPAPSLSTDGCSAAASDWVSGNLGASKTVYFEGQSIPYRLVMSGLTTGPGTHTVTIEWDTTKSTKHALDYLTSFNRTVATANPCLGVSGCNPALFSTFAIPADPQVTGAGVTPIAGNFTLYGGAITATSVYTYANGAGFLGDKSARITLTFTASVANPVLAWGGHIAARSDWGLNIAAINIPGSPYHMRLIDLDGQGGNEDRSLSADAVIFPGSITIIKDATPNGSTSFPFTASPAPLSNFNLVDDGTSANTHVFDNITNFTTYTVNETALTGWTLNGVVCTVTSPNGGSRTVNGAQTTIVLKEGENVTCTYSNTAQMAHLKLVKVVTNNNGGTAGPTDFTLSAAGPTPISGAGGAESDVNAGTYALSETNLPGYAASAWSCVGGAQNGSNVTLAFGESATCTITNDDQAAHLKLVKVVTNSNGGNAVATDFTLSAAGPTPISGAGGAESDVNAGTYALSETNLTGYAGGAWSCVGGAQNGSNVTLALGESATCTITNDDQAAHLKLVKVVTNNNGGNAVATDFTLSAAGPTPISGAGGAESDINAGTYALSETNLTGYAASAWSCVGGAQNGSNVTLALGESATCTITNDDIAPALHLRKVVINDNGGTATVADFTLTADGTGSNDLLGTSPVDSGAGLLADTWALSETNVAGYAASAWSCVGGAQNGSNVTLALGESATCTITNDDIAPALHLRKVVINDNGGTATVADFTLTADGTGSNDLSGTSPVDSGAGLLADTWALSETNVAGYAASAWSCVGGAQNGSNVTLALGESATCTITNDDQAAHLKLVKVVTNNNGGNAVATDFTLSAAGPTPISGAGGAESDINAGTYALSETNLTGYAASAWSCVGGAQNGSNVTLALGESATCTITNDDQAAHLKLVKVVTNNNGGNAVATDFTLSAAGPTPISGAGGAESDINAGTYALSETNLTGYAASAWSCVGGAQNGSNVTLALGESATCTITNDDIAPALSITKVADAAQVTAPGPIGFTITVTNADGAGIARAVTLSDPLPGGAGVSWSIQPVYSGPGTCSIAGAAPNQTLTCSFGDMDPGASASVHVTSATTSASAGTYSNTATASATNAAPVAATATTKVIVTAPVSVQGSTTTTDPPTTTTTIAPPPEALPFTGANAAALAAIALVLIAAGATLALSRRRRRSA